jgi:hypothetical protein
MYFKNMSVQNLPDYQALELFQKQHRLERVEGNSPEKETLYLATHNYNCKINDMKRNVDLMIDSRQEKTCSRRTDLNAVIEIKNHCPVPIV